MAGYKEGQNNTEEKGMGMPGMPDLSGLEASKKNNMIKLGDEDKKKQIGENS